MDLDTNEALLHWLEHEGLSPFTLLKVTPKPTAKARELPARVTMEWGLEDLAYEGEREKFLAWRVTAEELEVYRSEGDLDRFEECNAQLGDAPGIDFRLEAGGTLVLRCARLVVSGEPVERFRKGQPRPHHGEVNLELDLSSVTWGKLRGWLGIPADLSCVRHRKSEIFDDDTKPSNRDRAVIVDRAGHELVWLGIGDNRLQTSRGKWAPDELWADIWSKIASVPGVTRISSRDLVCPPASWPEQPPPKPAPRVWPDIYGVACDFAELTLDELRNCLQLSATGRFVFEGADAPELQPRLTLGEAARRGGHETSGVFEGEDGKPLVRCRADLREGVLSFERQRPCDDATWRAVWTAPQRLPGVRECHSRTTQSPPDPWPAEPPAG